MAKTVYYGTTMEEAQRIAEGDYATLVDGMIYTQAHLRLMPAIGDAERCRVKDEDQPAVVHLQIKYKSLSPGNKAKIRSARLMTDKEILYLTEYTFNRAGFGDLPSGIVVRLCHRDYMIECDGREYRCSLRRKLTPVLRSGSDKPLTVGDRVKLTLVDDHTGVIETVMGRTTAYGRTRVRTDGPRQTRRPSTVLPNLSGLIIVNAALQPPLKPAMIDKFLVIAAFNGICPIVCLNKIDLVEDQQPLLDLIGIYRDIGYDTVMTSAETGEGIDELRAWMQHKTSGLVGTSGVGKSSLLNAIQTDLRIATKGVNERKGGRHTTSATQLYPLEGGGYVADTPGIRTLQFMNIEPQVLRQYFPEMQQLKEPCHTQPCYHTGEPGCAVKKAVEDGIMAPSRYESYLRFCGGR